MLPTECEISPEEAELFKTAVENKDGEALAKLLRELMRQNLHVGLIDCLIEVSGIAEATQPDNIGEVRTFVFEIFNHELRLFSLQLTLQQEAATSFLMWLRTFMNSETHWQTVEELDLSPEQLAELIRTGFSTAVTEFPIEGMIEAKS